MIEEYTASVYSALFKDLSEIQFKRINGYGGDGKAKYEEAFRRPRLSDVEIYSFPQTWSSTALGFGGIGGQAFSTALTVVVMKEREVCVYFGGEFAYRIDKFNTILFDDIRAFDMAEVAGAQKRYGL